MSGAEKEWKRGRGENNINTFLENKYTNFKNGVRSEHGGMHPKPQHPEELPQVQGHLYLLQVTG